MKQKITGVYLYYTLSFTTKQLSNIFLTLKVKLLHNEGCRENLRGFTQTQSSRLLFNIFQVTVWLLLSTVPQYRSAAYIIN